MTEEEALNVPKSTLVIYEYIGKAEDHDALWLCGSLVAVAAGRAVIIPWATEGALPDPVVRDLSLVEIALVLEPDEDSKAPTLHHITPNGDDDS